MYIYVNNEVKGYYQEFDIELDDNFAKGVTYQDFLKRNPSLWILLSEDQLRFKEYNPTASVKEVLEMTMDHDPDLKILGKAKSDKIMEIRSYDSGPDVNSFVLNDKDVWITADKRSEYASSLNNAILLGEPDIEFEIGGDIYKVPVDEGRLMLAKVGRYADKAYISTVRHIRNIEGMENVEDIRAYDYKTGYPDKEVFSIV